MSKQIFRCDRSGLFFGELVSVEGQTCVMKNVQKLFYWSGAACAEQFAMEGPKSPKDCKFTMIIPEMTVYDLTQKIPCTQEAINSIEGVTIWKIR